MASFLLMCDETTRALRRERVFRDRTRHLDTLNDQQLIARYRMPRKSIVKLLEITGPKLESDTCRSHALSPETKLLITLRFLGKGGFFVELGDLHGVVKSSVSRVFHPTIKALDESLENIAFKTTNNTRTKQQFFDIAGFPKVAGAIDGTLIPIKRPPLDVEAAFVCRKGYHAVNVQAVCDADLRFTNVVAKWPGSAHDAAILTNSALGQYLEEYHLDGYLLGDSGYGCRPWLLTPLTNPITRAEERYNSAHCRTRNVIERAFGVLKSRFRCLHKTTGCLPFTTRKCCSVIMTCFKLHNFCMDEKLPAPDPLGDEEAEVLAAVGGLPQDGHQTRINLIQTFFTR